MEDARIPAPKVIEVLSRIARGSASDGASPPLQALAIRALGRLEHRDVIPVLLELTGDGSTRRDALSALVVTLRAQRESAGDPLIETATEGALQLAESPEVLAYLPYTNTRQVQRAEASLMAMLTGAEPPYGPVAAALEVLARKHRSLHSLKEETLDFLRAAVRRSLAGLASTDDFTPRVAMAALMAAGQADGELIEAALRDRADQVRRLGIVAVNSAAAGIDPAARTDLTRAALADRSALVRYEALRGWVRREASAHGCSPIIDALGDDSLHVVLTALDALGDRCLEDETITEKLLAEARTPPTIGEWQREAHAFVALGKRSRERAATMMPAFISHQVWQVRMYAARAAAAMKDVASLDRLAYDAHDNVREATLVPLRRLKGSDSDAAFLDALRRSDYQLLRSAAITLKDAQPDKYFVGALADALERVTAEKKETSRDTRLALLERLAAMSGREQLSLYERLRKDFDPRIAAAAAEACTAFSTRPCSASPQPLTRPPAPTPGELGERVKAVIAMDTGPTFEVRFNRELAPLAYARFVRLARAHYYDGLTFHRIVPNFVIQGGSPGANEYVGDGPFMRDELGGSHVRGAIGISTRGRDTGDAQIFINLVDNPTLDFEYTVFASVPPDQMRIVDEIQEGARILRISFQRQN